MDPGVREAALTPQVLEDAPICTTREADIASVRALPVHAGDDQTRAFCQRDDYEPSPTGP
jgi:hypothetical protein